jgi:hypothetical protein
MGYSFDVAPLGALQVILNALQVSLDAPDVKSKRGEVKRKGICTQEITDALICQIDDIIAQPSSLGNRFADEWDGLNKKKKEGKVNQTWKSARQAKVGNIYKTPIKPVGSESVRTAKKNAAKKRGGEGVEDVPQRSKMRRLKDTPKGDLNDDELDWLEDQRVTENNGGKKRRMVVAKVQAAAAAAKPTVRALRTSEQKERKSILGTVLPGCEGKTIRQMIEDPNFMFYFGETGVPNSEDEAYTIFTRVGRGACCLELNRPRTMQTRNGGQTRMFCRSIAQGMGFRHIDLTERKTKTEARANERGLQEETRNVPMPRRLFRTIGAGDPTDVAPTATHVCYLTYHPDMRKIVGQGKRLRFVKKGANAVAPVAVLRHGFFS